MYVTFFLINVNRASSVQWSLVNFNAPALLPADHDTSPSDVDVVSNQSIYSQRLGIMMRQYKFQTLHTGFKG